MFGKIYDLLAKKENSDRIILIAIALAFMAALLLYSRFDIANTTKYHFFDEVRALKGETAMDVTSMNGMALLLAPFYFIGGVTGYKIGFIVIQALALCAFLMVVYNYLRCFKLTCLVFLYFPILTLSVQNTITIDMALIFASLFFFAAGKKRMAYLAAIPLSLFRFEALFLIPLYAIYERKFLRVLYLIPALLLSAAANYIFYGNPMEYAGAHTSLINLGSFMQHISYQYLLSYVFLLGMIAISALLLMQKKDIFAYSAVIFTAIYLFFSFFGTGSILNEIARQFSIFWVYFLVFAKGVSDKKEFMGIKLTTDD